MILAILAVVIGLIVLVWSADTFIEGATELAIRFNLPSFIVGVVILGVGTSAPEIVVSAFSAAEGSPGIALGNAYGSNIINITLVLGLTTLINPIIIRKRIVQSDLMLLMAVIALSAWLLSDNRLSLVDGMVLIATLVAVLVFQIVLSLRDHSAAEEIHADRHQVSTLKGVITLIVGLSLLILSSRTIVWGAVNLATLLGMSELIIGLTIIAIGTSLPELVATIAAAKRGEHEMALGNVIGSNLFNTLGVVGLAAIISPMDIEPTILQRDMLMVGVTTVLLFLLTLLALSKQGKMQKSSGALLISTFIGYSIWLALSAS